MSRAPIVAFFNNKGGVGKTSLVYHLAWMYSDLGEQVLAVDLDPQANLTAALISEERLETIWARRSLRTVFGAVLPLIEGTADISESPPIESVKAEDASGQALSLLPGDLQLSEFEDQLSENWPKALGGDKRAFRILSAFYRMVLYAAKRDDSTMILMDLGPNLGALNRAALIAADFVVIPLAPDLFSIQGLRNLGPRLRTWRCDWAERRKKNPLPSLEIPEGRMQPLGYIVQQHSVRLDRPTQAYDRWIEKIPQIYREAVLDEARGRRVKVENDPHCLALLKHYRSLMAMAQQAKKPIFQLRVADGALGAHYYAVSDARKDFNRLATAIKARAQEALAEAPRIAG